MPTPKDCRKCGRPYYGAAGLLCDECDRDPSAHRSAVATIRRQKYPNEYSGWNVEHDSPKWTSDRMDAAPIPIEILVSELNKVAAREPNIWAVVYPQNAKTEGPPTKTSTETNQ